MAVGLRASLLRLVGAVVLLNFTAGCTGYRNYHREDFDQWPPRSISSLEDLAQGDDVRVTTSAGDRHDGVLESVEAEALVVSGVRIAYDEMDLVQVRGMLWQPTVVILAGAAAAGIVFFTPEPEFSTHHD